MTPRITCAECGEPTDSVASPLCTPCAHKFVMAHAMAMINDTPPRSVADGGGEQTRPSSAGGVSPIDKHSAGLYEKFHVERTDGSSEPGGKHDGCDYFVLDLTHDPHAIPALRAYADSCAAKYPALAADLRAKLPVANSDAVIAALRAQEPRDMRRLRWLLATKYSGSNLYTDDGEYSDSSAWPHIDFRRDSVAEIERKMRERALQKMSAAESEDAQ